jgi:L-lactate dehydrogenase complex protein LldF
MARAQAGFVHKREVAIAALPEFEALRAAARDIKDHTLAHLDYYLERFEAEVLARGGEVHWARTPEEACEIVLGLCRNAPGRRILKGKSMIGEEIALNEALQKEGFEVLETDLGEYIIQLAGESPSHIIAPAVHKTRDQISALFHEHHGRYGRTEWVTEVATIVEEARQVLRAAFLQGDIGITGANFLIAETGSSVLVTNEGNGDLASTLPPVHIVLASLEKVIPTLEDAAVFLRLLGRSATGQVMTSYTSFFTGPRRGGDPDGPQQYHVVLVDHGRARMVGTPFRDILRCIRCGACLNHCPVYAAIGGHAYGWVYPGPMGAVLTSLLLGLKEAGDLPFACTLNGRCAEVCPTAIPLPHLLRTLRAQGFTAGTAPGPRRLLAAWAFLVRRPQWYRTGVALVSRLLALLAGKRGRISSVPLAAAWTDSRELPAPEGQSFQSAWRKTGKNPQ